VIDRLLKRTKYGIERVCHYPESRCGTAPCYNCPARTKCNADLFERLAEYEDKAVLADKAHDVCRAAIEHYGAEPQKLMVMEEMSELQKELCKNSRGKDNRLNIAEEIADVLIMLEQMVILYDCAEQVEDWHKVKVARLKKRIGKVAESECCN